MSTTVTVTIPAAPTITVTAEDSEAALVAAQPIQSAIVTTSNGSSSEVTIVADERGPKGDQGAPGPSGSANTTAIAGVTLSGERVVTTQSDGTLIYHDPTQLSFASCVAFITVTAAVAGSSISIVTYGPVTASFWSWTPGNPIFLGPSGTLTQSVPSLPGSVFLLQVAVAETATTLFWDPQPSIVLA